MEYLKNLPLQPEQLADLIQVRPGQVVSMSLCRSEQIQISLFAFAAGENVSEEAYCGDVWYYVIEGEMPLTQNGSTTVMPAGSTVAIPAGQLHAIGGEGPFKLLQITLEI